MAPRRSRRPALVIMPVGMHLAAVMDAGSEPGVAHQVAGIFEALDRSDGGQEGDRCQHGDPWQLGQQRDAFILCSFLAQDFFNCIDLLPGEGQGIQVGCDDYFSMVVSGRASTRLSARA